MINILHLIWIVPLSAVAGVAIAVGILIFDDCLWWASDRPDKTDFTHNNIET